jgi:membrane protein YqaA with SNARE-associated domain
LHGLGFFLTWWGAALLAALDSSMLFFLPFGIDTVVIYLAARDETLFWVYPVLAAFGSVMGAAITYWIGHKAGEVGLERLVPAPRLQRIRDRVRARGAVAMAVEKLPLRVTARVGISRREAESDQPAELRPNPLQNCIEPRVPAQG